MSTFSAFRSVAVELLHLRIQPSTSYFFSLTSGIPGTRVIPRAAHRSFHLSTSRRAWIKNTQATKVKETEEQRKAKEKKRREIGLRDNNIPYKQVQVVTREGLSPFRPLNDVIAEVEHLNALDQPKNGKRIKKRYCAQLIVNEPDPIVKIIDNKVEFEKQKEAHEKEKNNAAQKVRKEVQLTWASSEADVETKLEKMKGELERGYKVDLAIVPRKGMRPPRLEDMRERVQQFVTHFSGVAKEWKETDFTKTTAVIYLQGTASPSAETKENVKRVPKSAILKQQRKQKLVERLKKKQEREDEFRGKLSETDAIESPL